MSEMAGALSGLSSPRAHSASFSRHPGVGGDQVQETRGEDGGEHACSPHSSFLSTSKAGGLDPRVTAWAFCWEKPLGSGDHSVEPTAALVQ